MFNLKLHLLNPQQREAVQHIDGPMLLLAGAGSGKTRVITHRVGFLIANGVDPANILAVSFTNKAANEMSDRVATLVGKKIASRVYMSTFHSLGVDILKHHIQKLGYKRPYSILDAGDQIGIIKDLLKARGIDPKKINPKSIASIISIAKMEFGRPLSVDATRHKPSAEIAEALFDEYHAALTGYNAVDFDDLICLPMTLMRQNEAIRQRYNLRFQYVMVDEYQDTNRTQLDLIELLVRDHHNIVVVGDDDQSIYGFRGAVAGNILEFEENFPGTKVIKLEQNYRSSGTIIKAANAVIANNRIRKSKTLWSAKDDGAPVCVIQCNDAREEGEFVVAEIMKLRAMLNLEYSDFAVLYRVNPQSMYFEEALRAENVPFILIGGTELFERREVKDFIAYLKACMNPNDEVALRRIVNVPPRGIGPLTLAELSNISHNEDLAFLEVLKRIANNELKVEGIGPKTSVAIADLVTLLETYRTRFEASEESLAEIATSLRKEIGLDAYLKQQEKSNRVASRRIANVDFVITSIANFEERSGHNIDGFLTRITLDRANAGDDDTGDRVSLMTLHSSKGLEFPVVFLVGFEESYLPHERSLRNEDAIAEERRLAYVGITRAKDRLYITYAKHRSRFGTMYPRDPSRFLAEIPSDRIQTNAASEVESYVEKQEARNKHYLDAIREMLKK